MVTVVSVKFKNKGKSYYFDPGNMYIADGAKVIVETSKGLELADCVIGPHDVPDETVVLPLRPVIRVATTEDLASAERNKAREKEAFEICRRKIAEHKLDMKLIEAEYNFEGSKTTFYFTSDERVDFRELVKDLAGVFRNRIELRQIGVRDEAKLLGGIGMCGRPYCCHQYMDDFKPVSTKMAKIQNLSLNPTKISGSCGRLMCCLRYEQEAYEELNRKVPHQGAFVETTEGYGTAVQVNLLRQTVKVRLDSDKDDDDLHEYRACEVAAVPGGRPKDGEEPKHVLHYVPEEETVAAESPAEEWEGEASDGLPAVIEVPAEKTPEKGTAAAGTEEARRDPDSSRRRRRPNRDSGRERQKDNSASEAPKKEEKTESGKTDAGDRPREEQRSRNRRRKPARPQNANGQPNAEQKEKPAGPAPESKSADGQQHSRSRHYRGNRRPKSSNQNAPKSE